MSIKMGSTNIGGIKLSGIKEPGVSLFGPYSLFDATSFGFASGQDYYQATPSALNYNFKLIAHYPRFQYKDVKNKRVKISADYYISNMVQGGKLIFSACTMTSQSAQTRQKFSDKTINEDGEGYCEFTFDNFEIENANDDHYVSMVIYAYTGSGSTVRLKNIKFEMYE